MLFVALRVVGRLVVVMGLEFIRSPGEYFQNDRWTPCEAGDWGRDLYGRGDIPQTSENPGHSESVNIGNAGATWPAAPLRVGVRRGPGPGPGIIMVSVGKDDSWDPVNGEALMAPKRRMKRLAALVRTTPETLTEVMGAVLCETVHELRTYEPSACGRIARDIRRHRRINMAAWRAAPLHCP